MAGIIGRRKIWTISSREFFFYGSLEDWVVCPTNKYAEGYHLSLSKKDFGN
jgi:hypothetical protein